MDTKTKIDNAIKWIEGLAKTRYKQGRCELGSKETGFCCLGYGCHILGIGYEEEDPTSGKLRESVGLSYSYGRLKKQKSFTNYSRSLAELNDNGSYTFNQISKEIIKHCKDLFIPSVARGIEEHFKNK